MNAFDFQVCTTQNNEMNFSTTWQWYLYSMHSMQYNINEKFKSKDFLLILFSMWLNNKELHWFGSLDFVMPNQVEFPMAKLLCADKAVELKDILEIWIELTKCGKFQHCKAGVLTEPIAPVIGTLCMQWRALDIENFKLPCKLWEHFLLVLHFYRSECLGSMFWGIRIY